MLWLLCSLLATQYCEQNSSKDEQEIYFQNLLPIEEPISGNHFKKTVTYQQLPLLIIKNHENSI